MERVHYAGGSILTGTAIARALLDYAEALAQAGSAATVVVPAVAADGRRFESHLLVGPSSQMLTIDEPTDAEDPVDEEWVHGVRAASETLRRHGRPAPTAVPESPSFVEQWIAEL